MPTLIYSHADTFLKETKNVCIISRVNNGRLPLFTLDNINRGYGGQNSFEGVSCFVFVKCKKISAFSYQYI